MHATDFLPILSTSRLLFCALPTVQLGETLHAQLQPGSFVAIPSSFRVVNYMDLGPPCDRLEKFLAWILGSQLWFSFMERVTLVRGFQWAKLTSTNTE